MGIEYIREIPQGRGLTLEPERSEYTRVWLVKVEVSDLTVPRENSIGKSPLQIAQAVGIPQLFAAWTSGNYHEDGEDTDDSAGVNRIEVQQEGQNPLLFRVTVHFTTEQGPSTEYHLNPFLRPAKVEWSFRNVTRIADTCIGLIDDDGELDATVTTVLNSADDAFDPPAEKDDAYQVVRVTVNNPHFDPVWARDKRGTINHEPFANYDLHCARIMDIRCTEKVREAGIVFYPTTFEIEFRREGWDLRLLDAGYQELGPAGRVVMRDTKTGSPFQSPQLLDGAGVRLDLGLDPVYRTFQIYEESDFGELGIEDIILNW